jgi:hypothetical protein
MQTTGISNDVIFVQLTVLYVMAEFQYLAVRPSVGLTFQSEHKKQTPFFMILVCRIYGLNCNGFNILI